MPRHIKSLVVLVTATLVIGVAGGASAFDNKRKGFVLGFGFGPGYVSADHKAGSLESDENNGALTTNFKIGAGLSDRLLVYYVAQATWFNSDGGIGIKNSTVSPGLAGVGVSYYVDPEYPSLYFVGGAGVASWFATRDPSNARTGVGVLGGFGYEFRRFWHLEATFQWGSVDGGDFDVSTDLYAISLTFSALGY